MENYPSSIPGSPLFSFMVTRLIQQGPTRPQHVFKRFIPSTKAGEPSAPWGMRRPHKAPECSALSPEHAAHSPGQGKMLHSWYSRDGPRHGSPPNLGSGLLQTRFRLRMPLLQSRLHWDQDVQADHAPLTVWAEYLPARRKSPESPAEGREAQE